MTATSRRPVTPAALLPFVVGLCAAVGLGTAAVAADQVGGRTGTALQLIFGSGPAWLLAAMITGGLATRWASAIVAGMLMLTGAVGVYYLVIDIFDTRPGADLGTGMILWGVLGVTGGAGAGLLGLAVRRLPPTPRALVIGAAGGALASEGFASLLQWPPDLEPGLILVTFGLPLIGIGVLVRGRRLPGALLMALLVGLLGGIAWLAVDTVV